MARNNITRSASRTQATSPQGHNRDLWADHRATPNPEAPAQQKEDRNQRLRVRLVKGAVYVGLPVAILSGLIAGYQAMQPEVEPLDMANESTTVNDTRGKALAYDTLQKWIAAEPSPLPGGQIITWDGFTREAAPIAATEEDQRTYSYEQHRFTVERGGMFFEAAVQVAVDDVFGAVSTSTPSLTPVVETDTVAGVSTWFDLPTVSPSESVQQAVESWAQAYTSGDSAALRQAVQDQNLQRSYVPLTNVDELLSATIADAASVSQTDDTDPDAAADRIIARVQLQLWWNGGRPEVSEGENEALPEPISYDVLIEKAQSASPVVVAWGAPGTGPDLTDYENAIDVEFQADDSADDTDQAAEPATTDEQEEG